jgi:uncharacterized DUF497 family protein/predicted DNA binding CopG/RHH family protein
MEFEWDESKRAANLRKHGIDFLDVSSVFNGSIVTVEDERFDYGEDRFVTFGLLQGQVIVVVHTESEDSIRIISARKATKYEQKPILNKSETDWQRLDTMTDDEIDLTDCPEITPEQFAKAIVRNGLPVNKNKAQVTLRIDNEVLEWFKSQGKGYQTQINSLLRAYMEAHN